MGDISFLNHKKKIINIIYLLKNENMV